MNVQQVAQPRSSNGYGRRRVDREVGMRTENKMNSGKSAASNFSNAATALVNGGKIRGVGGPSRDRLIYVATCLVGHFVEVHVKNGSIISGIFHSANVEKDFGIVLKMARVTKDGSVRGHNSASDTVKKPQNMIIPARELVQVIAKDVTLSTDEFTHGHAREKREDLMTDSVISHSHHAEVQRELQRWTPDEDVLECPELENIFDGKWNRNWDQFETNKNLFGVKSTFDEELYTTKLERGPQTRELEIEASRIAREIEGEETGDLHIAEERGVHFHDGFDLDEESRFSAVRRELDDGRFEEEEDLILESRNVETFGGSVDSVIARSYSNVAIKNVADAVQESSTCSSVDEEGSSHINSDNLSGSSNYISQLTSDHVTKKSLSVDSETRLAGKHIKDHSIEQSSVNKCTERIASEEVQTSKSEEIHTASNLKVSSPSDMAYSPVPENRLSGSEFSEPGKSSVVNDPMNSCSRPGSSTSSASEHLGTGSALNNRGLSPSSSVGSLSSEKSKLNPYAKEFKFNPNAKSFTPSASLRPHTPPSDGSYYYGSNISVVPQMQSLPMGIGIGPSFGGQQPVVYNPQAAQVQTQQTYMHPNGPLYGQQMIMGQPRPVLYMPTYPHEMTYKGRNF